MRFGISTHLYHEQQLSRDHLAAIASYGFEAVEVFATRSHFDYHDPESIERLDQWLKETGLSLHSIHAPITDRLSAGDQWGTIISNAVSNNAQRQAAVRETDAALNIARRIPTTALVVHLGTPKTVGGENSRSAAFRSIEEICALADPLGIRVALELIPNELSDAHSLVTLLDLELDAKRAGICLDFGHAYLMGDVPDIIETVAEHLTTTHLHDNGGKRDEHLVPFGGRIEWNAAMMSMQKVGYDGTYMMEVANTGSPASVLEQARIARQKLERLLTY
jgi:sugar phosphate isomerase/epimerase